MENSSFVRPLTNRFVAGLELDDAVRVAKQLQSARIVATLDRLGENVTTLAEATEAKNAYLSALSQIAQNSIEASVSVKLTALGLDISEPDCLQNASALLEAAHRQGTRVEFDMESSEYTTRTLRIVHQLHSSFPGSVRAVIQAYLYRSGADVDALSAAGIPIRLCKGAYQEPASVAFPDKAQVDAEYVRLMKLLFVNGTYPAIATHDESILETAFDCVRLGAVQSDGFEFQMLYGVRRDLQKKIVEAGLRLRLYVPYGAAWYPYFMRRLAERPANVWFVWKSLWQG